ncbi:MAG: 50S ribosomal protein L25/general stress protein Ctc [Bacteroidota bacterium]|nr:50S ribosomal protein L25/general stress protein Ctc [Bacteroidota bacterium]
MKSVEIKGALRKEIGKKYSNNLRKEKEIPCVLYGQDENVHFHTNVKSFKKLVYSPDVYAVDLDIDGKHYKAVMQAIQFHPVSDEILHADFYHVDDNSPITMRIPTKLEGIPVGVTNGGRLVWKLRKIKVRGLIANIPDEFVFDVTKLTIGDSIKIADVENDGIELLDSDNSVIAICKSPRKIVEPVEGEEGEEGEEGAAEGAAESAEKSEEESKAKD